MTLKKEWKFIQAETLFLNIHINKHINTDVIADISDPEYEFEIENPKAILSRYWDLKSLKADSLASMNEVYDYVHTFDFFEKFEKICLMK